MKKIFEKMTSKDLAEYVKDYLGLNNIEDFSDGYHSFKELYRHRAYLFATICNLKPELAWKSKKHADGTMYEGMFIAGYETPYGQARYHYEVELYWDIFNVKELENAPEWDGHTSDEAIDRIYRSTKNTRKKIYGKEKNMKDITSRK